MININKVSCFTDVIHGTIQYSGIERAVISTPLFNRLHRILQNSLVYLTFPSNKTKRFEHSIGTMHLAGKIFHYSILNANKDYLNEFFQEVCDEIDFWWNNCVNSKTYRYLETDDIRPDEGYSMSDIIEDFKIPDNKLYKSNLPANITENKHKFLFSVIWQAVRLAGLLHDVGHLPYSHVMENSIENLLNSVILKSKGLKESENLTKSETYFMNILSKCSDPKDKSTALHEIIGKEIYNIIKESIEKEAELIDIKDINSQLILALSFYFAEKILESVPIENNIFSDLHTIISGMLDADRLDYCSRDQFSTGVRKDIINYERILNPFSLGRVVFDTDRFETDKIDETEMRHRFVFSPSSKQIKEIEEVLTRRWAIFSDINYHHNVHKTELLMVRCVEELGKAYFENGNVSEKIETKNKIMRDRCIPLDIQGLWHTLNEINVEKNSDALQYSLIQLDDSWLDTVLKRMFMTTFNKPFDLKKNKDNKKWHMLNELVSAKKSYVSVIKRADDFFEFDEQFFNNLKKNTSKMGNILKSCSLLEKNEEYNIPIELINLFKSIEGDKYSSMFIVNETFVFNTMGNLIINFLGKEDFFKIIQDKVENAVVKKCKILDCILGRIKIKTGISTKTPLYVCKRRKTEENQISQEFIHFNKLSNLNKRLIRKFDENPFFHAYICTNNKINLQTVISEISKQMADAVLDFIIDYLNETIGALKT